MKKKMWCILLILIAIMSLFVAFSVTANAEDDYGDEIYSYVTFGGEVTISDCYEYAEGYIEIPETLGGVPVTSIGKNAFADCKYIKNIKIPSTVKTIEEGAFKNCTNIKEITIPQSVTSIGANSFYGCNNLVYIRLSENLTYIGDKAFMNCSNLKDVTIPAGVTEISNQVFAGCSDLTRIVIPDSVNSIGYGAFLSCVTLNEVIIPNSVKSLGEGAFQGCNSIKSLTIPNSVTSIGNHAFQGCTAIQTMIIPDSVVSFGKGVFQDCKKLYSVGLPGHIKSIPEKTFYNCYYLLSVTVPNTVTRIETGAFSYCYSLSHLNIPSTLKVIDDNTFTDCTKLATIYFAGSESEWNNVDIGLFNQNLMNADVYHNVVSVIGNFSDVLVSDWFSKAVEFVSENKYFQGVSEHKFGPNEKMTRAMLVTVIGRVAQAEVSGLANIFEDVGANSWYCGYVAWAAQNNIVGGVGNGVFAPNNNITREQIAVILMRYASYKGYSTDITSTEVYDSMTDTDKVSAYAVDAMKWATSNKIIGGSNGKLNPTGFATRSEVAQMIMNFCNTFNV